ncbi:MAG: GGDEF domain-containing protein [Acidobacteria bacterium]|nr:GGDEF domain-containing protein [Acidobacteriota bacterium]
MSGMISVKSALSDLDRQAREIEERERVTKGYESGWRGLLSSVEEHLFPLFPSAAKRASEDWRQVQRCLSPETTPRLVERALHTYAQESRREQREDLEAVKSILEAVAAAAAAARARTENYSGELAGVCEAIGRLVQVEDPDQLRRQLTREASSLRESVTKMMRESQDSLAEMEADLRQFQKRLVAAETAASTDVLTGLANRREFEKQLDTRVRKMSAFSVLLFDLDYFKSVNDRFGHDCGDQLLRQVAEILNEHVRPGDIVARWGGDEFIVLLDCPLVDALRRCQQITDRLGKRYSIQWQGKAVLLPIRASSGVVEYVRGESAATLFRRADEAMYAAKARRSGG